MSDDPFGMLEDDDAELDRDPVEATDRQEHRELAQTWRQAGVDLREATRDEQEAHERAQSAAWWSRRRADHQAQESRERLAAARERHARLTSSMRGSGVGADRTWSALSVIPGERRSRPVSLETTLEELHDQLPPAAGALLRDLPGLRARVALDEGTGEVDQVHQDLLAWADGADPECVSALHGHLPGSLRPLPDDVTQLRPCWVRLMVYQPGLREGFVFDAPPEVNAIRLADIVTPRHQRGQGLGSAVLTQLCRLADRDDLLIYGTLEPGPRATSEVVPRLAAWYARHGFSIDSGAPSQSWHRGVTMTRFPAGRDTP